MNQEETDRNSEAGRDHPQPTFLSSIVGSLIFDQPVMKLWLGLLVIIVGLSAFFIEHMPEKNAKREDYPLSLFVVSSASVPSKCEMSLMDPDAPALYKVEADAPCSLPLGEWADSSLLHVRFRGQREMGIFVGSDQPEQRWKILSAYDARDRYDGRDHPIP